MISESFDLIFVWGVLPLVLVCLDVLPFRGDDLEADRRVCGAVLVRLRTCIAVETLGHLQH